MDSTIILYIGLIIFISHVFTSFFETTKIPDIFLLILLGIIINLFGFDHTPFHEAGEILFEIALALILFEAGIHLKFNFIYQALKNNFGVIFFTFIATFALVFSVSYFFMFNLIDSIVIGLIMSSISPAVVIPLIGSISSSEELKTAVVIQESDIFQIRYLPH